MDDNSFFASDKTFLDLRNARGRVTIVLRVRIEDFDRRPHESRIASFCSDRSISGLIRQVDCTLNDIILQGDSAVLLQVCSLLAENMRFVKFLDVNRWAQDATDFSSFSIFRQADEQPALSAPDDDSKFLIQQQQQQQLHHHHHHHHQQQSQQQLSNQQNYQAALLFQQQQQQQMFQQSNSNLIQQQILAAALGTSQQQSQQQQQQQQQTFFRSSPSNSNAATFGGAENNFFIGVGGAGGGGGGTPSPVNNNFKVPSSPRYPTQSISSSSMIASPVPQQAQFQQQQLPQQQHHQQQSFPSSSFQQLNHSQSSQFTRPISPFVKPQHQFVGNLISPQQQMGLTSLINSTTSAISTPPPSQYLNQNPQQQFYSQQQQQQPQPPPGKKICLWDGRDPKKRYDITITRLMPPNHLVTIAECVFSRRPVALSFRGKIFLLTQLDELFDAVSHANNNNNNNPIDDCVLLFEKEDNRN